MTQTLEKYCHSGRIMLDFSGVVTTISTPHATRHTPHATRHTPHATLFDFAQHKSLRASRHSDNFPKKSAAYFLCFHEMPITTGVADLFRTPVFAFVGN
jgi:hypothetical protein